MQGIKFENPPFQFLINKINKSADQDFKGPRSDDQRKCFGT